MALEPGQVIDDRYEVKSQLGQGGMGAVWNVKDTRVGDDVVLKLPLSHGDPEILKRFGQEARTMRRFSRDCMHILDIQDVGDLEGVPYYVMRHLPGGSLREWKVPVLSNGQPAYEANSFKWLISIAGALDFIHSRDCLHRDVKPENILFNGVGNAFLVDFGIVKTPSEATTMTHIDGSPGTLAYMPPEVLLGEVNVSGQADQYALAVTLYEVLAGHRPFDGPTSSAVYKAIYEGQRSLKELCADLPQAASAVVDRALSQDVANRFSSCSEFVAAFIGALSPVQLPSPPPYAGSGDVVDAQLVSADVKFSQATPSASAGGEFPVRKPWKRYVLPIAAVLGLGVLAAMLWTVVPAVRAALAGLSNGSLSSGSLTDTLTGGSTGTTDDFDDASVAASLVPAAATATQLAEEEVAVVSIPAPASPAVKTVKAASLVALASYEDADLALLRKHAELGFSEAETELGFRLDIGKGTVGLDDVEAVRWYEKAAAQNNLRGLYLLGTMYNTGEGVPKNQREAVKWFRKSADQGFAKAQNSLGLRYDTGKGVGLDDREAVRWYQKAADQGLASAQYNLGLMYKNGEGIGQDFNEAVKWFRLSAEQGHAKAENSLGVRYDNGEGVPLDDAEAVKWYRKAADQNNASGQYNLALMYKNGEGVAKNLTEAVKWFRKAADQGHASAQNSLGLRYDSGEGVPKDDREAVKWYRNAADQGLASAQSNLGLMYKNGEGITRDYREAVRWFRLAAEQGHAQAQNNLALRYDNGEGVPLDDFEAVKWYRKAAEQNNASAQYNLGLMYKNGEGVAKNYSEAVQWFWKAANQGHAKAQNSLAVRYDNGEGVQRDDAEAVKWYLKSAQQGNSTAQYNLGLMYDNGEGVAENDSEAIKWFRKAAAQGDNDAKKKLKKFGL